MESAPIETSNIGRFRASLGQLFNGFATPVRLARNKPDDYSNFVFMSDRFHDPRLDQEARRGRGRVPARRDLSKRHQESASLVFTRGKDFISCTIDFLRFLEIGLNSVLERKDLLGCSVIRPPIPIDRFVFDTKVIELRLG